MCASRPMPATLKNGRSARNPTSTARGGVENMRSSAAAGSRGTQSDAASPFPDPAGTSPSAVLEPTSAEPTSLTVPSPPQTTTRSAPLLTAAAASSRRMTAPLGDVDRSIEPAPRERVTNERSPRRSCLGVESRAGSWIDDRDDACD